MSINLQVLALATPRLLWTAVRAFLVTLAILTIAGVLFAWVAYQAVRELSWIYCVAAPLLALVESIALGIVLGYKQAITAAVIEALRTLRLAGALVKIIFEKMLAISDDGPQAGRGEKLESALTKLPLRNAEARLAAATQAILGDPGESSFFRKIIRNWLVKLVHRYTLRRFRKEDAEHGGIDVVKAKNELENTIDDDIINHVSAPLRLWTFGVAAGLPLLVGLQTWALIKLAD